MFMRMHCLCLWQTGPCPIFVTSRVCQHVYSNGLNSQTTAPIGPATVAVLGPAPWFCVLKCLNFKLAHYDQWHVSHEDLQTLWSSAGLSVIGWAIAVGRMGAQHCGLPRVGHCTSWTKWPGQGWALYAQVHCAALHDCIWHNSMCLVRVRGWQQRVDGLWLWLCVSQCEEPTTPFLVQNHTEAFL